MSGSASRTANRSSGLGCRDFDVHGIVGIRLLDADAADIASVQAELGLAAGALAREPDIVVRFVDRLPAQDLRYVEVGRSGFTDEDFFVLRHRRRPVRVRVPFDRLGSGCEFACERGVPGIPFLLSAVKLAALQKGYVAVHGAAFASQDTGVVVAGWSHGGKTSALLAFTQRGASFISDDVVFLRADGGEIAGLPTSLSISAAQLDQLPALRRRIALRRRFFFRAVRALERLESTGKPNHGESPFKRLTRQLLPALQRRSKVHLAVAELFGSSPVARAKPGVLCLMMSHASPEVRVEPLHVDDACARMLASLHYEERELREQYLAYQYACPGRRNEFLEQSPSIEATLLRRALATIPCYLVRHPYPAPLTELHAAMRPVVDDAGVHLASLRSIRPDEHLSVVSRGTPAYSS